LASARTLRYTSHYISTREDTGIEGYFDFGGDITMELEIWTPSAMKKYVDFEWEREELVHSSNSLVFGWNRWVVAPAEALTEEVIRDTILRWYQDRFEFVRGHWSQVEDTLPELIIDSSIWESDEDRAERLAYIAEVSSDPEDENAEPAAEDA